MTDAVLSLLAAFVVFLGAVTAWVSLQNYGLRRQRKRLFAEKEQLVEMVEVDDLTSAYSRRYIRDVFAREPQQGGNALAFIDLDNFKSVNDGYGHKSGDALLRAISDCLMAGTHPNEIVFRIGGDEFGVYMRDTELEMASLRAEQLRRLIRGTSVEIDGVEVSRTASIGVARIVPDQDLVGALYYADEAQYAAKQSGGDVVRANSGDTLRSMIQRRTGPRAEDLAAAIARQEITYHVQPIFNTQTGRAIGVEALMRWQKSDGRVILPGQFLDVMRDHNSVRLMPAQAEARRISEAFTATPEDIFCAFNISADVFNRGAGKHQICARDLIRGLNPKRTVFEIVEYAAIRDAKHMRYVLNSLRERGVRVALDDFGTGLSNLERLQELEVDIVKIDRRFVRGITKGSDDIGILRALLEMSRTMGFEIIAEGVETEADLETLQDLGIWNVQGYLLGRPDTAAHWVERLGLPNPLPKVLPAE